MATMKMTACLAAWGLMATTALAAPAATPVAIDDTGVFPESLTSTAAGDLIIGSSAKGTIYRAGPNEQTAKVWIDPKTSGMSAVLGVFADEKAGVLYVCSAAIGAPPDKADGLSALRVFDLATGAPKAAYPMPGGSKALCNDIAITRGGDAYVSETIGGRILRLKKGAAALEVWLADPKLASVDGIAVGSDGQIYVNTVQTNRMFRVQIRPDGTAGDLTELIPSAKLDGPDGLRAIPGGRFLQAENRAGQVSELTIVGTEVRIRPLKSGEPGLTAMTIVRGKVWATNAKFAYRSDPALKGKDPNPFTVEPIDLH